MAAEIDLYWLLVYPSAKWRHVFRNRNALELSGFYVLQHESEPDFF